MKIKRPLSARHRDKLTGATNELAAAQSTLRDLQARVNEVNQAVAGYDKTLQDRFDSSQKALGQRLDNAKAQLKELTQKIDDIVTAFDADLANEKAAVAKAKNDADKAAQAANDANQKMQSAQADLESEKKRPQTISASLQEIKSLLDQIAKADSDQRYVDVIRR